MDHGPRNSSDVGDGDSNESFLTIAKQAAKESTQEWVRSVFRETFFQAVQQIWKVSSSTSSSDDDDDDDDGGGGGDAMDGHHHVRVEVTSWKDVEVCLSSVERLSQAWQVALRESEDHQQVAEWVEEVFRKGQATFWMAAASEPTNQDKPQAQGQIGEAREELTANLDGMKPTEASGDSTPSHSCNQAGLIPYCELRGLGRKTYVGEPALSIEDALERIQTLERNNAACWPLDLAVIDNASVAMAQRMQMPDRRLVGAGKSTSDVASSKTVQFELLQSTNQEQGSSCDCPSQNKRKWTKDADINVNVARPPWDLPNNMEHNPLFTTQSLSNDEKKALDQLVSGEDQDGPKISATKPPLGLFGGLEQVGKTNQAVSEAYSSTAGTGLLQERLDPHRLQKNETPKKMKSKFLKTEHWADKHMKYFDLDLGWSLLEAFGDDGKRHLYAFSSLEMTLDDRNEHHQ